MSDLKLPQDDKKKPAISWQRMAIWLVVGTVAIYMIITGLAGVIAKG